MEVKGSDMIEIPENATLDQIAHLAAEKGETITRNQVSAVLAAYINVMEGDPVGMVRRDSETGALAVRVNADGVHMWRVSNPTTGEQYNDMQPTLDWPEI
jgi:hypothetical protein